ncbi:MAG: hypothetical protein FJ038_11695 [Chloroflexi bacterium]|nr:hypothetical protein [Chloroflexota bacterium]
MDELHIVFRMQPHAEYHPVSYYAETTWLPLLGPTAWLLGRRFAQDAMGGDELRYPVTTLAAQLGVQPNRVVAACRRLCRFGLGVETDEGFTIDVLWPPVRKPRRIAA